MPETSTNYDRAAGHSTQKSVPHLRAAAAGPETGQVCGSRATRTTETAAKGGCVKHTASRRALASVTAPLRGGAAAAVAVAAFLLEGIGAGFRAGRSERRSLMRACSSCVCTRAQHHSLSNRMSSRAASPAGAAGVCALARRDARKKARDTARARRTAPERNS